jgi:hypothetical protein
MPQRASTDQWLLIRHRQPAHSRSSHRACIVTSMTYRRRADFVASILVLACSVSFWSSACAAATLDSTIVSRIDWAAVDSAMGRAGVAQPGDVRKFSMPRTDLTVTLDQVTLRPALALGSWIAFKAVSGGAIAMGDLVLLDTEVARVMARLQEGGIEQTAVHHHLLRESPRVIYMHVHGHGEPIEMATTVRAALALTGTPSMAAAPAIVSTAALDTAGIARALGYTGRMNGGVYQVSAPRREPVRDSGIELPASMGVATAINFQPTSNGRAAITGDFVLVASEVNPVIRALRRNGIEVTSLHNHLLNEEPRLFFMHFWANDDALKLARGLREALDLTGARPQVSGLRPSPGTAIPNYMTE